MSIKEMIAEHPDVDGHANDRLGDAVRHAMYAAAITNSCADACLAEPDAKDRAECIRRCLDASDACTAAYRIGSRRTGRNVEAIAAALRLAVTACEQCLEHCAHHDDAHCRRCAEMCREMIRDCTAALDTL